MAVLMQISLVFGKQAGLEAISILRSDFLAEMLQTAEA